MVSTLRWLGLLAVLGTGACQSVNLDPVSRREFPKENGPIIRPPTELLKGSAT
jgi:hypothetical protein